MIKCPACDKEYIDEDTQLVCEECGPGVNADMAIVDIFHQIEIIDKLSLKSLEERLNLLKTIRERINKIIHKTEKDK